MKRTLITVGVLILLVAVWGTLMERTSAQASGFGRYQVVNGTPDVARNIMLLDTASGDTWIYCNESPSWCKMPRLEGK